MIVHTKLILLRLIIIIVMIIIVILIVRIMIIMQPGPALSGVAGRQVRILPPCFQLAFIIISNMLVLVLVLVLL